MESEDDMHDANDVESLEDFYSGDNAIDSDDDGDYEFIDNDSDDDYDDFVSHRTQNYAILNEADIHQCQQVDIMKISTVLSISKVEAGILLRHYNWSVSKVNDEWFADEAKVRRIVGLLERPVVGYSSPREMTCGICFENFPSSMMSSAACGHSFCNTCWAGYIGTAINDGPGCLTLRCPDPSCSAAIGQDMINKVASKEDKEKYDRYFLRSYIEDNRKAKWCPAPGCDYAVDFVVGSGNYDVSCRCSHSFCWNVRHLFFSLLTLVFVLDRLLNWFTRMCYSVNAELDLWYALPSTSLFNIIWWAVSFLILLPSFLYICLFSSYDLSWMTAKLEITDILASASQKIEKVYDKKQLDYIED